jgi:ribosome biogenesis GTPase
MLAIAAANDLPTLVLITKADLGSPKPLVERMRRGGHEVIAVSAREGTGMDEVVAHLEGRESILAGPSGVGKSSLLNRIQPGLGLRTAEVSERIQRGKNTTVAAVMVPLDPDGGGGFVVDTPGFSDAGLYGVDPRELAGLFPDLARYRSGCRFDNCSHRSEPACSIREAADRGELAEGRYESYLALYEELVATPKPWE